MQKKIAETLRWGGTLPPSITIKARLLLLFCYKLPVDTISIIRDMDMAYHYFIAKVSIQQLWTTEGMDICLVTATKCWLSRGILLSQG